MISLISGKIVSKNNNELEVMTAGGVGYRIMASPAAAIIAPVGSEISINTYLVVKEDSHNLFGFANLAEKELFKNFISVSGVGPKTALHLLELGSVEEITLAIGRSDVDYLTKVSGIGKKTAERLVVELKNKVAKGMSEAGVKMPAGDLMSDVIDALVTLGYTALQARDVIKSIDSTGKNSEQLLREALQKIR
ncbi:MAG: Holliday junction branch migration protein RuvA [Patescibacteria group bacterium]|jgi:Holliday junction DNA helicase RuvA